MASAVYATVFDPLAAAPMLAGAVLSDGSVRAVIVTALVTVVVVTVLRLLQQAFGYATHRLGVGSEAAARLVVVMTSGVIVVTTVLVVAVSR